MQDQFDRTIDYMRVSITDRCNLRCRYCMPEDLPFIPHPEILRYEEILQICAVAAQLGVETLKVTGGEPLVRRDCVELLRQLKALPGIRHVTLTTNGVLLKQHLPGLVDIGIDGINISLDTLDREMYQQLTGRDDLAAVLEGLHAAVESGLRVKVNCVPLAGYNDNQLLPLAELAAKMPVDVRFIEMMPVGLGGQFAPVPGEEILRQLHTAYPDLAPTDERRGFGPARYYRSGALQGRIGFIDAVSHSFCHSCNRIRLTSEGKLRLCLSHDDSVDLRALLRSGAGEEALRTAMTDAIFRKPKRHNFGQQSDNGPAAMSQIGG